MDDYDDRSENLSLNLSFIIKNKKKETHRNAAIKSCVISSSVSACDVDDDDDVDSSCSAWICSIHWRNSFSSIKPLPEFIACLMFIYGVYKQGNRKQIKISDFCRHFAKKKMYIEFEVFLLLLNTYHYDLLLWWDHRLAHREQ